MTSMCNGLCGQIDIQALLAQLVKGCAVSLLTGLLVKWYQGNRERSLNGVVKHRLQKDYVLIVGYDFQVKALIKRILSVDDRTKVLLMTDHDVKSVRLEVGTELTPDECGRLLFIRRNPSVDRSYAGLRIRGAKAIYLMGDEGGSDRDGKMLRASEILVEKAKQEQGMSEDVPVEVFLQLVVPQVYARMCSRELKMDTLVGSQGEHVFNLHVFNYYESWVWTCWSLRDSTDGEEAYLPLRFKPGARRTELFVIGGGPVVESVVGSAIKLMNYGDGERNCRITVFANARVAPDADVARNLPEVECVACPVPADHPDALRLMQETAARADTSTTIVIAGESPDATVKAYLRLPLALRCSEVSVLLWMDAPRRDLPNKALIESVGPSKIRYFGMIDQLPWMDVSRFDNAMAVNYFYSTSAALPKGTDVGLLDAAVRVWDADAAAAKWSELARWAKWSNVSSGDCLKEKAALLVGQKVTGELLWRLLKAEHNRWWTERLLADWRLGPRDNARRRHPNLVPFEDLDEPTQDLDKVSIAVMAVRGYMDIEHRKGT